MKYLRYLYFRALPRAVLHALVSLNDIFILDFSVFLRFGAIIAHLLHFDAITAHEDATTVISVNEETRRLCRRCNVQE